MYIFMCILNRSALQQLNGSTIAIASPRTSQHGEASTSPIRRITKPVALCASSGYKASFEACLVDLGGLEKHNFNSAIGNSRKHHSMAWFSVNSHKASPLEPVFELVVVVTAVLNGFKLVIVAVMTKLMVTTGN